MGKPAIPEKRRLQPICLRPWREFRGLTQEQLAEALEVSVAQISRIERGKRQYTQAFLEAAAEYLQTDVISLLTRDPTQPENIWSLWARADTGARRDIERYAAFIIAPGKKSG